MVKKKKFARAMIERLPLYYRTLQKLEDNGFLEVSSIELAKILGTKPEQIRKDLTEFGNFGIKGLGYDVTDLKNKIGNIIGFQNNWRLAVIGVGNVGAALAKYEKIADLGFVLAALFDVDENLIGEEINGLKIYDFKKFNSISRRKLIDIGVIAVPENEAQNVADILVKANIKGIWNFASVKLEVPEDIVVVNQDFTVGLSTLSFYLSQNSN